MATKLANSKAASGRLTIRVSPGTLSAATSSRPAEVPRRFDDRLQMKIDQLRKATASEVDKSDLLPSTTYDVAELWRQLSVL